MNLCEFEKSPQVMPLLVQLYEGQRRYNLSQENRPLAKKELADAVDQLLNIDLSEAERELLSDILVAMIRQAETDLRQALAERLSTLDRAPLRLILHLANDDFRIAEPVLRHSEVLSDLDLIYIIKSQGANYWQAIARRERLGETVVNALAETRDYQTAIVLSHNDRITLTHYAIDILSQMAVDNEDLARPLLVRPEIPQGFVRKIYRQVGADLKDYIAIHCKALPESELDQAEVEGQAQDILVEFAEDSVGEIAQGPEPSQRKRALYMPTDKMLQAARRMKDLELLNFDSMMRVLKRGQVASFIAMFAIYSGISAERIHGFLRQPCPKGFAIACKALRIQKSDFSHIYLLTNGLRTKNRIVNHQDMAVTLKYYDKLKASLACRILERETRQ